jgi:curli production assembly/transport component CsgG
MKKLLILITTILLYGCATTSTIEKFITGEQFDDPIIDDTPFMKKEENLLAPPTTGPIPIAVYGFNDKTGQRKSVPNIASLSSAVTQGAENYLIKALKEVGNNRWFIVLERVGLDNLIKERQMIRQTREQFQGKDAATPLPAMTFAGIIAEGAIVGYDSNTVTGGAGVRIFGIGGETQYQSDTVTVSLRVVSVTSGEILTSVVVTKTVLSYMDKVGVLRMFSSDTKMLETEIGGSINESINKATNKAIQAAVLETIKEGARKGHWSFKEQSKETSNETVISSTPTQ